MLISIIIILCAFNWLLLESDFLRIHLLVGSDKPDYSGDCALRIYHSVKDRVSISDAYTECLNTDNFNPDCPVYQLILSPNVEPMCYDWLRENYAQLVTFKPEINLDYGCYRQHITFNGGEYSNIMRQVMKIHDKKFIKQLNLLED